MSCLESQEKDFFIEQDSQSCNHSLAVLSLLLMICYPSHMRLGNLPYIYTNEWKVYLRVICVCVCVCARARFFQLTVRALFNYQPEDDLYNPCKEIGLAFSRGDILHIISQVFPLRERHGAICFIFFVVLSQDDPNWWQGYREGDDMAAGSLAGLIPSPNFQQEREQQRQRITKETRRSAILKQRDKQPLCAKLKRGVGRKKRRTGRSKKAYNPADLESKLCEWVMVSQRR